MPDGGWSIPTLMEAGGNNDFFTRHCENCGQGMLKYILITEKWTEWHYYQSHTTLSLETHWQRAMVIDEFPAVLCFRVNRFLFDRNTLNIAKNTAAVALADELEIRNCESDAVE